MLNIIWITFESLDQIFWNFVHLLMGPWSNSVLNLAKRDFFFLKLSISQPMTRQQNVYKNNSKKLKLLCIKIFYFSENESSTYLISIYQQISSKKSCLTFPLFFIKVILNLHFQRTWRFQHFIFEEKQIILINFSSCLYRIVMPSFRWNDGFWLKKGSKTKFYWRDIF